MRPDASSAQPENAAFQFVQALAAELTKGDLVLPSFPDAVVKIRRALEDESCTPERLTRIAAADQALAGRLIKLANSALLKRGTGRVTDLRTAITRLGFVMVRNTAISVAMQQMFHVEKRGPVAAEIKSLWQQSTRVAACCYALAKHLTGLNPDEAFLAGLLHNVGKVYIYTRSEGHEDFLSDPAALQHVLDQWHGPIGKTIIESWGFSEAQADAAESYRDLDRHPEQTDLTDIVQIAWVLIEQPLETQETVLAETPAFLRLALDADKADEVLRMSNDEIQALAQALSS